jgi:cytidine deaminase
MNKTTFTLEYEVYDSIESLDDSDRQLLESARKSTELAYAPYSKFLVGATAKLLNGQLVHGSNQENASYPVGICAERVLLSTSSTLYPNIPLHTMAIAYRNLQGESNRPISPCGLCRQTMVEFENRTGHPFRVILSGMEGQVFIIPKASGLLPLSFTKSDLLSDTTNES